MLRRDFTGDGDDFEGETDEKVLFRRLPLPPGGDVEV